MKGGISLTARKKGIWDVSEEEFLTYASPMKIMIFVNQIHRRKLERLVDKTGLHRAQHRMLMTLSDHEFDSQTELAAALEISTATVAVSLKKLERDGYIQKTVKAEDSRANFVQATKGFTEEELVFFRTYLKRMYDNLSEISEKGR